MGNLIPLSFNGTETFQTVIFQKVFLIYLLHVFRKRKCDSDTAEHY